ncbi:MAG: tetratricopeptide repeat protein [Marinifilaceae bacterium]
MKKTLSLIVATLLSITMFAQTAPGAAEKNAGNDAVRSKNYAEALKQYEAYLKIVKNEDKAIVFNAAFCADKVKNYPVAEKYFKMSIDNNYKPGAAYLGLAKAYEGQKKTAEMLQVLQDGMKSRPTDAKLASMYATYYLKEGQKFQKSGNTAKAVENYTAITTMANKQYKTLGYQSLATLYFNNGASIMEKANPIANTDKAKFDAEKARATAEFNKAKENAMQAKSLDPANTEITALVKQIEDAMKQ